jgi:hypothetical protein
MMSPAISSKSGTIWHMSEQEKYEQVGRLAEEVSHIKGKLAHLNEKLTRAQMGYQFLGNPGMFSQLRVEDGKLALPPNYVQRNQQQNQLDGLLSTHELIQVLEEKERLTAEFNDVAARLKTLAPHLL